ncbi:MAG: DUF2065 domain-containing protein [Burkholderiales bacterium]|jgi:uncharacterized protein YjeT (DUF2065 family)|nr:DUF2065 domain-containing protein [Burkholderiales bacterium]
MKIFWMALAFVFILEGLLPLLMPAQWREVLRRVLSFNDGQLRFIGLISICSGLILLTFVA